MSGALASGAVLSGIEACKAKLQALPGNVSSELRRLDVLESAIKRYY
jgi:hypothetical protein